MTIKVLINASSLFSYLNLQMAKKKNVQQDLRNMAFLRVIINYFFLIFIKNKSYTKNKRGLMFLSFVYYRRWVGLEKSKTTCH